MKSPSLTVKAHPLAGMGLAAGLLRKRLGERNGILFGVLLIALACLVLLYGAAFSTLFICMPRLNIARNAPVMNMEPVAGMLLGWLILGQVLGAMQVVGGLIVVGGIVLLALRRG